MLFQGFSRGTTDFLAGLAKHNSKPWFDAHRADYEAHYLAPAIAFVEAVGPQLLRVERGLRWEPRVNGSILRVNRDVRFSKDKRPYKDHLDLFFWTGDRKDWEHSGLWFRLTAKELMFGTGLHQFSPEGRAKYLKAVADAKKGAALAKICADLRKKGYTVGSEGYKKVPRGFDPAHPRASLLKHDGLWVMWEGKHPKEVRSPALATFVARHFAAMAPLHRWVEAL